MERGFPASYGHREALYHPSATCVGRSRREEIVGLVERVVEEIVSEDEIKPIDWLVPVS